MTEHEDEKPESAPFAGEAQIRNPKDMSDEEILSEREKKIQERLEKLRKRDPFIYR